MAEFMRFHAKVQPSPDLRVMGWVTDGQLKMVVGFNNWIGRLCHAHVARQPDFTFCPRIMIREAFKFVFDTAERRMVLSVVNSNNERAMKMDAQLGFVELSRIPDMHEFGGDVVTFGMTREQCRYLTPEGEWRKEAA